MRTRATWVNQICNHTQNDSSLATVRRRTVFSEVNNDLVGQDNKGDQKCYLEWSDLGIPTEYPSPDAAPKRTVQAVPAIGAARGYAGR